MLVPRSAGAQTPEAASIVVFSTLSAADAQRDALAVSPDVAAARARLEQSRYTYLAARGSIAPALVANYAQVPQGNPPGPNIISRIVSAQLQWTLGDFLAFGSATQEAALALSSTQADFDAAQTAERVKVIGLYYDALKARGVADARRSALTLATAQRDAASARATAGDAPQLDVVRADVAVGRAEADLEAAVAADQNAADALRVETGIPETALVPTTPNAPTAVNVALTNPAAVVELARHQRPEIASAQLTARAADAAVRSARAAGFSRHRVQWRVRDRHGLGRTG